MRLASSIHINYTIANQGRIRELDWGIQTLVQKGVLNFFMANYLSPHPPPPPPPPPTHTHTHPQPLPLVAVARYNSVVCPWEHPPLVFGNNDCTDFVNVIVKVMV